MEQQVAEAALAMVRATTDSATRSAASSFLEQWTQTPEAWGVYVKWLQSFRHNDTSNPETLGMQLLCLTLLLAKIRREVIKGKCGDQVAPIRDEVWSFLQSTQSQQLIGPLCSCVAALVARCDQVANVVSSCPASLPPSVALRLISSIPPEMEACGDLTTPQVTAELWPHMEKVLDTVRQGLSSADTAAPALDALRNWAHTCHVTLSHLNSPTCGGTETLLPVLIHILSQPSAQEDLLILASRALTEAILVPSDSCTPSRQEAVSNMIAAIPQGFVAAPLQYCTNNRFDDGAHALATLICTLVSEEVDDLCSQPGDSYLGLLLRIQAHPHTPVSLTVLECWLTVQDIPTSQRHEHWKAPLFMKIAEGLVTRLAYTKSFVNWQEELDLDEQEFFEFRRMVNDVLVNCYFLLRVQYIRQLVTVISTTQNDWTLTESALFCLSAVFREVCARVKARGTSTLLSADRTETAQLLLQLVQHLCGGDPKTAAEATARQHPLVLGAASNFMGRYAPAWNVHCNDDAIFQVLAFLRAGIALPATGAEASKATKSIYIQCASQILGSQALFSNMRESMEVALSSNRSETMSAVSEGCTRLIVQMKDQNQMNESLKSILTPLMRQTDMALSAASTGGDAAQREQAVEALTKYLHVLQVVIRFCDSPPGSVSPLGEILAWIWPLLEKSAQQCASYESVLNEVLAIQRQLLSNAPALVAPRFSETVKFVVEVFENTKHPSTLDYLAAAVESFSSGNTDTESSFNELLAHVTSVTVSHVTTEKRPDTCPQLIRAFFEMNQRYVLFCPASLVKCREFPTIVNLAVECLTACNGERESTRATLIFLAHLFGWKSLRLAQGVAQVLEMNAGLIDEQLAKYGEAIIRVCIAGLGGNSPQMLWPALSDCVIAIVTHVVGSNAASPVVEDSTIAHQWVYSSLSTCTTTNGKPLADEPCQQIVRILFDLARHGSKSKPKAKMLLTDFARLCKGETAVDALLSYTLGATDVQR